MVLKNYYLFERVHLYLQYEWQCPAFKSTNYKSNLKKPKPMIFPRQKQTLDISDFPTASIKSTFFCNFLKGSTHRISQLFKKSKNKW